jgi:SulP family sulfate permease
MVLEKRVAELQNRQGGASPIDLEVAEPEKPPSGLQFSPTAETTESAPPPQTEQSWVENYEGKKFHIGQLFPPVLWLPIYMRSFHGTNTKADKDTMGALNYNLRGDVIAGLTVGVMLVPQCLAFALLAGMPVQVGLFSSFAPLIMYAFFGTIRQVQTGPTALMSLLTGQALDAMSLTADAERIAGGAILALLAGVISIFLGAIRFGFVVDFMSHTVMQGFCSAAGVTIASSQLKHLLGIKMPRKKYWWKTVSYLISHLNELDPPTFFLGGSLLSMLLTLKYWKSAGSAEKRLKHPIWRFFPKNSKSITFRIVKIVADLSSILCVVLGWLWCAMYRAAGNTTVKMVGEVDTDGFEFLVPGDGIMGDIDIGAIIMSAAVMSIVGYLETVAVGGKFAMQAKYEYDPNQELLALGIANVAGSVMGAYPTTGSFSRTAVNAMLGATSLLACALSATVVFIATYVLLGVIRYLPLAALAPIIIQGAIGVVSMKDFKSAWGSSKAEFVVMVVTFVTSLVLTVKEGLGAGFVLSVLTTLRNLANPNMAVCGQLPDGTFRDIRNFPDARQLPNAIVVRMDARLGFFNSRKMKEFCLTALNVRKNHALEGEDVEYLIIDGRPINHIDLTGSEMLESLSESLHSHGQKLIVASLKTPVLKVLDECGLQKHLIHHDGHLLPDMDAALKVINKQESFSDADRAVEEMVERGKQSSKVLQQSHTKTFSTIM